MLLLFVSPDAETDLDDIWTSVASCDAEVAGRLIDAITNQFQMFQSIPNSGQQRSELREGLGSFAVGGFLIFYQSTEERIEIVRVLSGARHIAALLDEDN